MRSLIFSFLLLVMALNGISATRYTDCRELKIVNRPYDTGTSFARLDCTRYGNLPADMVRYSGLSTGMAVSFTTDSPYIKARWTTTYRSEGKNTTPLMQSGLDLYVRTDSVWVHAGVGLPSDSLSHKALLVENMPSGIKECLLYMPLWNCVESLEIGVADTAVCQPGTYRWKGRVAVVGSSITHGASASRPGLTYPARLQRVLDTEVINLGFSGLCKLDSCFARFIADTDADLYVIDAFSNPSPEQIDSRLKHFVDLIREHRPYTPLLFLQTEERETGNFDLKKRDYEQLKRDTARRGMSKLIAAGYRNLYFLDPAMPLGTTHELTVDGTHPTDAGFELITSRLIPVIKPFLHDRTEDIRERLSDRNGSTVLVASHRGDWRNYPENSIEGLKSAIEMGVDIVELDIQRTKDGHLILMHDETLDRTTTGKGAVADTTLSYIKTLKLRNGCGIRTSQRVPTLEDALITAKGKVLLNLDKADRYFDEVVALLEKTDTKRQIVMKGTKSPSRVRNAFSRYLDDVIYMPIVDLDEKNAVRSIDEFVGFMNPVAFELLFRKDANTLPLDVKSRLAGKSLIWYNTLWDTMAGGHDDDASLRDVNNGWGYLIDSLGCRIIQTDRPAMLLEYLRSRGLHN